MSLNERREATRKVNIKRDTKVVGRNKAPQNSSERLIINLGI